LAIMSLPKLPAQAAYIHLRNASRRNALSKDVLNDLRTQLRTHLTSPKTGSVQLIPRFNFLSQRGPRKEKTPNSDPESSVADKHWDPDAATGYRYLLNAKTWEEERAGLPKVLVLRSEGPVFSSGHDLAELASASPEQTGELFHLCNEVLSLIWRSPVPIVCPIQGLATGAGLQLALTCDYPIALDATEFQLPGSSIGLPCTGPASVLSHQISPARAYRMFLLGERVAAKDLSDAVDVVTTPEHAESTDTAAAAFEARVSNVVERLVGMSGLTMAQGKWAYATQLGNLKPALRGIWATHAMTFHAQSADAREGMRAFVAKEQPKWTT
jgi:enoyl-CoA hydratase/carnithine racemase